jgi:hypothetical protein
MITAPPFTAVQVEYLKRLYPESSPGKGEDFNTLLWRGGQCDVVRKIEQLFRLQEEAAKANSARVQSTQTNPG